MRRPAGPGDADCVFGEASRDAPASDGRRLRAALLRSPRAAARPRWTARPTGRALRPARRESLAAGRGRLPRGPALLHAQDSVGDVAELKDIALQALDGEVLVDRADERGLWLEDDLVVGVVGNRAAGGERGEAGVAAAAELRG